MVGGVLETLKNSDLLISNPGFIDRIMDCQEDIQTYESTGKLPTRVSGYINMMKNALQIE